MSGYDMSPLSLIMLFKIKIYFSCMYCFCNPNLNIIEIQLYFTNQQEDTEIESFNILTKNVTFSRIGLRLPHLKESQGGRGGGG